MSVTSIRRTLVFSLAVALVAAIAVPLLTAQAKEPETVVLKGSPLGGVKFEHKLHAQDRKVACVTCHHASKAEKPMASANQKCTDCHTKTAAAPMKTPTRGAFHDAMSKKGTCIDCHVAEVAKGKKAPTKCAECHKKANV
jgi:class III cytochrome C family protein